jgi:hypothetical protein
VIALPVMISLVTKYVDLVLISVQAAKLLLRLIASLVVVLTEMPLKFVLANKAFTRWALKNVEVFIHIKFFLFIILIFFMIFNSLLIEV